MEQTDNKSTLEKKPIFYKKEAIVIGAVIVLLSLAASLLSLIYNQEPIYKEIAKIQININYIPYILGFSISEAIILSLVGLFIPLLGDEKPVIKSVRNWVIYSILAILGIAAYFVIVIGLDSFSAPFWASNLLASLIFSIYLYLMLKLYFYNYIQDKSIFYEVVRFALVGVIASMFDLATCYLFEFVILPNTWEPIWLTIVSVSMGFAVGVTVNYLCSVYMVFKATTGKDKSKTTLGRILFLALALVGLGLGYGLQYFFYDFLHVGYVLTFIIRTLIVLVWNYLSRKYFIFK